MGRSTRENFFLIVLQTHLLHIFLKSEIFLVLYCEVFGTDRLFPYAHKSNLNGLIRDKCSWKRSFVFKAGTDRQRDTERKSHLIEWRSPITWHPTHFFLMTSWKPSKIYHPSKQKAKTAVVVLWDPMYPWICFEMFRYCLKTSKTGVVKFSTSFEEVYLSLIFQDISQNFNPFLDFCICPNQSNVCYIN